VKTRFARRIAGLATIHIALVSAAVILAGSLFAFGVYVRGVSNELGGTRAQLQAAIGRTPLPDARAGGTFASELLIGNDSEIVFLDATTRVTVYREHRSDLRPVVVVRPRGDLSGDPRAQGPLGRLIVGLATAFGLQSLYAHAGPLYVIVKSNDAALARTVRAFFIPLIVALVLATVCALLVARALTRQAMRPLDDVTAALQRFASGDLTPQPIASDERHELGVLTSSYNDAVAQLERAFDERDRANASMRHFIADAGHQLRTPLTVVQGFIAILRRGGIEAPADRDRILETMNDQSRIMGSLIDKLILLERWESLEETNPVATIDAGRLVEDLVTPIADAHPDRAFSLHIAPHVFAKVDPTEFGYVVTNLTDNALKYGHGTIGVSVGARDGSAVVEITDQGPGIPSTDATRVFDRFYRGAQRDVAGSGLGLSIVKRAVERAGGRIDLDTSPSGSRFIVSLPRLAS
jgi:two-component system OmpR family sensor kinase